MCYFVLFWVNRSRNVATILTVSCKKFSSVGPPQFEQAVLVKFATVEKKVINIFFTRGTVPNQGTSYDEDAFDKQIKAPYPKVKGNFSFLASNDF